MDLALMLEHSPSVAMEAKIDKMVYKLYGLNDEEIAIVEGRDANNSKNEIGYNNPIEE